MCCSWYNGTHEFTNLTWTQGRRLSGITEGSDTYSYEYDMAGVRAVKLAGNTRGRSFRQSGDGSLIDNRDGMCYYRNGVIEYAEKGKDPGGEWNLPYHAARDQSTANL